MFYLVRAYFYYIIIHRIYIRHELRVYEVTDTGGSGGGNNSNSA